MQLLRCFHADLESYCHNRHAMPLESASVIVVTTVCKISREHLNFHTENHHSELHKLRLKIESKFFSKHEILLAFQFFLANLSKKKSVNEFLKCAHFSNNFSCRKRNDKKNLTLIIYDKIALNLWRNLNSNLRGTDFL